MSTQTEEVRRYYDVNTPAFKRYGQGGADNVIRRAIWGVNVKTRSEAFGYVDQLIAAELRELQQQQQLHPPLRVFDFGCGFGSSLLTLFRELEIEGLGVTLSALQARTARERFAAAKAGQRLQCMHADYLTLPEDLAPADLVFTIEAFVHCASPQLFFNAAARHIKPGGVVVVCDDFLTSRSKGPLSKQERHWIEEFRYGWVAPGTVTTDEASAVAEQCGFELQKNVDLTPYLELRRVRDRALSIAVKLARWLPIPGYRWRSLVGGDALQMAIVAGLIEHRFMTWRRRS